MRFNLALFAVTPENAQRLGVDAAVFIPFSRYVCASILIHLRERLHIDAVSLKTFSVLMWTAGLNSSKCMWFVLVIK